MDMSDPNTPGWLSNDTPDQTVTSSPAPASNDSLAQPAAAAPSAATSSSAAAADAPDPPELPSVILTMRLANMGAAGALIAISVMSLLSFANVSTLVLSIYAIIGGTLICCLETQLKFLREMIAINFGFLFSYTWRFLFYLLLGSVSFSYNNLRGWIVGAAFVAVAFYNTYVLCRYPSYRKTRDKIAEEEDKRIEARISTEVRKQMVNQATK